MSVRDLIRAATVGASNKPKSTLIYITEDVTIEVRAPTLARRAEILKSAGIGKKTDTDNIDMAQMQATLAIMMCYAPETNTLVFDAADRQAILECPVGGWADEVLKTCMELLGLQQTQEQVEKN